MEFVLPYAEWLETAKIPFDTVLYAAVTDIPELCGGRHPEDVAGLSADDARRISERLGPRFQVAGNSSFPRMTAATQSLFHDLESNSSRISLARTEFAAEVRCAHPKLHIAASCIASLYVGWNEIVKNQSLWNSICAPQYWNYDLPKMIDAVPVTERQRVHYIVNSGCRYETSACRRHYENISIRYRNPGLARCACLLGMPDAQQYVPATPDSIVKALARVGFTSFKFEGREFAARPIQEEALIRIAGWVD